MDTRRQALETIRKALIKEIGYMQSRHDDSVGPLRDQLKERIASMQEALAALTSMDASPQGVVEAGDAMKDAIVKLHPKIAVDHPPHLDLYMAIQNWIAIRNAAKSRTTPAVALRSGGYDELYRWLKEGNEAWLKHGTEGMTGWDGKPELHVSLWATMPYDKERHFLEFCEKNKVQYILIQPEQK